MSRELQRCQLVERSITKRFRKEIWNPFIEALKNYELIKDNDKIAVCISGGKDSMLMAKLMQLLRRFSDQPFEIVFLVMDPGYSDANMKKIESNAELLNIPITVFKTEIFNTADKTDKSPCYLCARMRRGYLYSKAQELGCNKIALGHHFNDVIETTLLGMLYGSQLQGMIPKLHSKNFPGMELIRPMYCIHEESIISWKRYNSLDFLQCACSVTEKMLLNEDGSTPSKRREIKNLIAELKKTNPNVDINIFRSIHSVCLDTFPGFNYRGKNHLFTEDYDKR